MASFAAVDFETASWQRDSACAVGLVVADDGEIIIERSWLVQPPGNRYKERSIEIHGIRPSDTRGSPCFDRVWPEVATLIGSRVLIAHNVRFDIEVLWHSAAHWGYRIQPVDFVGSYLLSQEAWPGLQSYRLDKLADELGIPLSHHDPLSDARAAALIGLRLCDHYGASSLEEVAKLAGYRLGRLDGSRVRSFQLGGGSWNKLFATRQHIRHKELVPASEPDKDHPLFEKTVAFTGILDAMDRREAVQAAVDRGAKTTSSLPQKTSYLVVGKEDPRTTGGMSSKMREAIRLIRAGHDLEIIDETEFLQLIGRELDRDRA